jgi:endonuclease YncB( thermonuclease family)
VRSLIPLASTLLAFTVPTSGIAGKPSVVPSGQTFTCTPVAVWDGDGPIWCDEGPRIRLAGIAAREMDGSCSPGHPCPDASGEEARDALVGLLGGPRGRLGTGHVRVAAPPLTCRSVGGGGGNRTAAWCSTAAGVDLNCAMVASGKALRWARYWGSHRCR